MATYSCRLCRINLAAKRGCVVCDPIRPNIVVSEVEDVSLAEVSKATVKALSEQLIVYRKAIADGGPPKELEANRERVRTVAGAVSKMLDSARKIQEDGVKAVKLMSSREKMDLFESFYLELPPAVRSRFMAQLQASEEALSDENAGWKDLAGALTNGN